MIISMFGELSLFLTKEHVVKRLFSMEQLCILVCLFLKFFTFLLILDYLLTICTPVNVISRYNQTISLAVEINLYNNDKKAV